MTIFGSNNLESMSEGKLIKFVEFRRQALTESAVRVESYNNRIYSTWEKDRKAELLSLQNQLRLKPIYKNPPPIWFHPALCAMFGDSFLEGTGLEGGDLATSSSVLEVILDHLIKALLSISSSASITTTSTTTTTNDDDNNNNDNNMNLDDKAGFIETKREDVPILSKFDSIFKEFQYDHTEIQTLNYIFQSIKTMKLLCKKYELAKQNGAAQLVYYFKLLKKFISNLQVGETLLLPGGIGESIVVYILEREDDDQYRFSVVNTNPLNLDWHLCDPASSPPLIKYQTVLSIKNITQSKVDDDAFWGILLKLAILPAKENTSEKLYDLLIPYLVDKPIDQIVSESINDPFFEYRFPQKSNTPYIRCLVETLNYLLKRHNINDQRSQQLLLSVELQFVEFIQHDLQFVKAIGSNERKIIELCCSEISRNSSNLGKNDLLSIQQLNDIHNIGQELKYSIENLPSSDHDTEIDQPIIHLNDVDHKGQTILNSNELDSVSTLPFFDRLRRLDDVNGLAGAPVVLPQYLPIDTLQIPSKINSLDDIIQAIRYCDRLCTLISVQSHCIKNRSLLKLSLIEQTFIKVIPCPKQKSSPESLTCLWYTPMSYSIQLDICICLGRILEHFISSAYSLFNTKSLDAIKLIITGCITSMIDVTLRHLSTDQNSEFCLHYMGKKYGGIGDGFGISMAAFDTQSETIELHTPELCVARAAILDYFSDQKSLKKIFSWENGHHLDESTSEFITNICATLAFPTDPRSVVGYITTRNQLINKNYPEFHILR